jgi:flavin reductase (DIM6/NTAB) family NADH-FMN oxidoreductase RutF
MGTSQEGAQGGVELHVADLQPREIYRLLAGSVVPRPIAWVTSLGKSGMVNAAPFSCYTFVSTVPPMVAISCGRKDGLPKDTVINAEREGEFVLNVVREDLLEPMHLSSAEFPPDVSEISELKIPVEPGRTGRTPRIRSAPVSMECTTEKIIEFGDLRTQLLVGRVKLFRVLDDCYDAGRIETTALKPIARLGGPYYARLGEILYMEPVADYFHYNSADEKK